jgi:dolichol-phosphate mannosyltransferase
LFFRLCPGYNFTSEFQTNPKGNGMSLDYAANECAPELSIVVPFFNEEENVAELCRRIRVAMQEFGIAYELILVNDGSKDDTPHLIDEQQEYNPNIISVHLSRNFGHQAAICAGIDQSSSRAVVLMDGDLQDPPEVLDDFVRTWKAGYDVVYAVRTKRKEGLLKRWAYSLFYRIFRATSDLDIPLDSGDFCLMDRKVVDALKNLPERNRFVRGLRTFVGFRQIGISYERAARNAGQPKYSFKALFRLAVDGIINFSSFPLNLVTYLGLASTGLSVILTVWVLASSFYNNTTPRGWTSTLLVVLFMGAVQLLSLGIIGEYVRRIFLETKQRPTYVIAEVRRDLTVDGVPQSNQAIGESAFVGHHSNGDALPWTSPLD